MKKNEQLISEFIRFLSLHDVGELRQKKYRYALGKIDTWVKKDFTEISKLDIEGLITSIINNDSFKDWTKHDYKVVIKKFFTWLYNKDVDDLDEWETPKLVRWVKIKAPKSAKKLPSELITPADIRLLVENSRTLREKAVILTLYESGARIGELLSLKIKDVDFDDYGAILNLFGKTGYRKVRLVGAAPAISQWLQNEHPKRDDKNAYLFCNTYKGREGKQLSYQAMAKVMKKLAKRANFQKDINFHQFRHSRATELAEHLTDAQRCDYFGWVQGSQICRVYTHLQDTDKAILELNGLIKKEKDREGKFKDIICPRCNIRNPYGSKFCSMCSMGLDVKSIDDYKKTRSLTLEKMDDPETVSQILEMALKIINEKS